MTMVDRTATPEDRYVVTSIRRHLQYGGTIYNVSDRVTEKRVAIGLPSWAAAHCEAQRLNREARAASTPAAEQSVQCCDCARYRVALEKVAQITTERSVLLIVSDAIDTTGGER